METFLLSKIEVGSHLYVNITDSLHFHGETIIVSSVVVILISIFLFLATNNLQRITGGIQNLAEVLY